MSHVLVLGLLLVLLPFVGLHWKKHGVMLMFAIGAFGLLGCAAIAPSFQMRIALLCQLPLLGLLSGVGFYYSAMSLRSQGQNSLAQGESLADLKERTRLLKEKVTRSDQEEARSLQIYGVAKGLAESLSWKEMAPRLSSGLQKLFGAYEFLLYSVDESRKWGLIQRRGNWAKEPPLPSLPSSDVVMVFPPQVRETVPVLTVPISTVGGGINGILFLKSSDQNKSSEDLILTGREFGEQLGVALQKALLFNQMEIQSQVDGLTGVLRRQPFMDRLNDELKRAAVFNTPFSLMMVDIDHFKVVNDTHGHAAGDAVLRRTGQILKESVYETDIVGRYGGEEFIILLPRADAAGVMRKAEALRQRFEQEVISSGFENLKITVSIGLAHFPQGGKTADALISSTDRALYQAKETGRNRVVAA